MTWLTSTLFSLFLLWIMISVALVAGWSLLVHAAEWRRRREFRRRLSSLGLLEEEQ